MSGTLDGHTVSRALVQIPAWGRPWADVELPTPVALEVGAVVPLVVGGVTLTVAVVSGGALHGKAGYRVVGGRGKWGNTIPRKSYLNDAGVRAALVLSDAAAACGETIADLPATSLGPHYARREAPASEVLNALAPRNWYVDEAGITRIGRRAASTYSGDAPRTRVDTAGQIVELAAESATGLLPGVTVDGVGPATDVEYDLTPSRLTVRVWGGPATLSRRLGALYGIVDALTSSLRYAGLFEFRVVTQTGNRLNLQPVRAASGLGDLGNVPIRPGVAGWKGSVALGERVLVAFVDRDPSRPVVVAHDDPDSPGWAPISSQFGTPALPLARTTDAVQAGPFSGVITGGSATLSGSS